MVFEFSPPGKKGPETSKLAVPVVPEILRWAFPVGRLSTVSEVGITTRYSTKPPDARRGHALFISQVEKRRDEKKKKRRERKRRKGKKNTLQAKG